MSSRFPSNPEAFPSELLENGPYITDLFFLFNNNDYIIHVFTINLSEPEGQFPP